MFAAFNWNNPAGDGNLTFREATKAGLTLTHFHGWGIGGLVRDPWYESHTSNMTARTMRLG